MTPPFPPLRASVSPLSAATAAEKPPCSRSLPELRSPLIPRSPRSGICVLPSCPRTFSWMKRFQPEKISAPALPGSTSSSAFTKASSPPLNMSGSRNCSTVTKRGIWSINLMKSWKSSISAMKLFPSPTLQAEKNGALPWHGQLFLPPTCCSLMSPPTIWMWKPSSGSKTFLLHGGELPSSSPTTGDFLIKSPPGWWSLTTARFTAIPATTPTIWQAVPNALKPPTLRKTAVRAFCAGKSNGCAALPRPA